MRLHNMQRSTGYIKTKGQVFGLVSGVRPVEFKVVTHYHSLCTSYHVSTVWIVVRIVGMRIDESR